MLNGVNRRAKRVGGISQVMSKWKLLYRYLRHRETSWVKKVLAVAALLYFIIPLDMIPDYLGIFGYMDDAVVVAYVWRTLSKELDRFSSEE